MNKVANYLQEHLVGEVLAAPNIRKYFSTDGSIFEVTPSMVVYPQNVSDVRKVTRFTWQLAEKGHVLPLTPRGMGGDESGAAIGKGIILAFPAHMNRLLELDTKQRLARMQPGISFRAFQDSMNTHGLFLPSYPNSLDYSTIGGAIANNAAGEKAVKYGAMQKYVKSLEVVLANGELIQTERLSKRELNRKKGLTTFEGEIYRALDGVIVDNWDLIQETQAKVSVTKNSAGYALADVKRKDGSFDLTPLFVGSQGTLGIVTEAILKLEPHDARSTLFAAYVNDLADAGNLVEELQKLEPSVLEMVDKNMLEFVRKNSPARLKNLVDDPLPAVALLVEFDDLKHRHHKAKKAEKIIAKYTERFSKSDDFEEQQVMWSLRNSTSALVSYDDGKVQALPVIEDGIVPRDKLPEFIAKIYELFKKHHLQVAIWGSAGDANLRLQPLMDLSKTGDRQKIFKLMNDYYKLVLEMGGSTSAQNSDGRLRGPYLKSQYGEAMYDVFQQVKKVFDPHGTMNPGVKIDVEMKDIVPLLRHEYSIDHFANYLPRA